MSARRFKPGIQSSVMSRQNRIQNQRAAARNRRNQSRRRQQQAALTLNPRTGGFLGIERKFLDVFASEVAVVAPTDCAGGEIQPEGGCTGCLSAPATGDGPSSRDGRKVTVDSIYVTGALSYQRTSDAPDILIPPVVYVALVQDMQTNGATVVSENVFTNPNDTALVNAKPLRNLENSTRYKVLDQVTIQGVGLHINDAAATGSIQATTVPFSLSKTFKGGLIVSFNSGTTADVANVVDNSLHIVAFATSTNYTPGLSYNSRIRFMG